MKWTYHCCRKAWISKTMQSHHSARWVPTKRYGQIQRLHSSRYRRSLRNTRIAYHLASWAEKRRMNARNS